MDGITDREIGSFIWSKEIYPNFSSLSQRDTASYIEANRKVEAAIEFTKGAIIDILDSIHEFQKIVDPSTIFAYDHFRREK